MVISKHALYFVNSYIYCIVQYSNPNISAEFWNIFVLSRVIPAAIIPSNILLCIICFTYYFLKFYHRCGWPGKSLCMWRNLVSSAGSSQKYRERYLAPVGQEMKYHHVLVSLSDLKQRKTFMISLPSAKQTLSCLN